MDVSTATVGRRRVLTKNGLHLSLTLQLCCWLRRRHSRAQYSESDVSVGGIVVGD
jgi:hypothetical protein